MRISLAKDCQILPGNIQILQGYRQISAAQFTVFVIKPWYKIRTPSHFPKLPIPLCCIKVPTSNPEALIYLLLIF